MIIEQSEAVGPYDGEDGYKDENQVLQRRREYKCQARRGPEDGHTENSRRRFDDGDAELPMSMAYRVGLVGGIGDRMGCVGDEA